MTDFTGAQGRLILAALEYHREVVEQWGDGDELINALCDAAVEFGESLGNPLLGLKGPED